MAFEQDELNQGTPNRNILQQVRNKASQTLSNCTASKVITKKNILDTKLKISLKAD